MAQRVDAELELYRGLVEEPTEYEEGFNSKTILGGLFIGFVMLPGAIYLGLVTGQGMGSAAEWTTVILFTEVARRSFMELKKQEVYILLYVAGSLTAMSGGVALAGGALAGKIWDQYFVQSQAAKGLGLATEVPRWVVPGPESEALARRTFLHGDWWLQPVWYLSPMVLLLVMEIVGRMNWFGLGYLLFRVTSDIERLPFPFAPMGALGATALAESTTKSETWRWRVFSIGSMVGLVFGCFYVGIPTVTGSILTKPLQLIPIPFVELTRNTESFLPATPVGIDCNLGIVLNGFLAPWSSVVGSFVATAATLVLNPTLFRMGMLRYWRPGMDSIETSFANSIDFYMSLNIGVSAAIAVIGLYMVSRALSARRRSGGEGADRTGEPRWRPPPGRGDVPAWICALLFISSTLFYVWLCRRLVPNFPWYFVVFFAFVLSPIQSYIDARMIGMVGRQAAIPMVKESTIILSGYRGIDIWFAPIPLINHGGQAYHFRVVELTGTKITSMIKAQLLILPISLLCGFLFWEFIWRMAPIPSIRYPYAQKMWHLNALGQGLWLTSTQRDLQDTLFGRALHWPYVFGGFGFAMTVFSALSAFRLPTMFVYGVAQGLGTWPHDKPLLAIGALTSRYYFEKRYGQRTWKQYAAVLAAGFACGQGLVGMGTVAIALIAKSVSQLPY